MDKMMSWGNKAYYIMAVYLKVVMDSFFVLVVSKIFHYQYYLVVSNPYKYILSWIIVGVLTILMPKNENSLKDFFLHVQLIFMVLPMLTIYAFTANRSTKYILMIAFAIFVEILILKDKKEYKAVRIKNVKAFVSAFMIIAIPLCTILIIIYGGFSGFRAFDMVQMNDIRRSANYPTILSYVIMWTINIIIPFYIVYCLEKRHYIGALFLVINSFILYMVLAQKSIYLSLLVIMSVYFVSKTKHLIKFMYIGVNIGITILLILCLAVNYNLSSLLLISASLVGDRFLFSPAMNKFIYYEVFSTYPKLYFSDGIIGKCMGLTNLYKYGSGQIVYGYAFTGKYGESNSCTGYLGDGYAQLGFFGVLICAVILAFLIKYVDSYCGKIAFGILAAITAMYVVTLNDAALQTVFFSCGFLLFLIFLAIYSDSGAVKRRG